MSNLGMFVCLMAITGIVIAVIRLPFYDSPDELIEFIRYRYIKNKLDPLTLTYKQEIGLNEIRSKLNAN